MEKDKCPRTEGGVDFSEERARKEEKVVYSKRGETRRPTAEGSAL